MDLNVQVATGAGYSASPQKVKMHPDNKMKTRSQNTYYIVRRVGKQETHPMRDSSQPGVGKCTAVSATSLEKHSDGNKAQGDLS